MPVSRKLISELRQRLQANGNKKEAARAQAYLKSEMPHYGVKTPVFRKIAKEVFTEFPLTGFENWYDTSLTLWRQAKYREERHCALALTGFKFYQPYQTLEALPLYQEMITTGAWWDLVDPIAAHRIRYLLQQFPKAMKPVLKQWSRADDLWLRRTAILCQLRCKQSTDLKLLYQCIAPSLDSKEFFLQKAIGWALRDYAWTDMAEVVRYVHKYGQRLSRLSQREALKHRRDR